MEMHLFDDPSSGGETSIDGDVTGHESWRRATISSTRSMASLDAAEAPDGRV